MDIDLKKLSTKSFGGNGGNKFLMRGIKSLQLRSGKYVDAIIINEEKYGGYGGSKSKIINLSDDEYIVRVEVRSGKFIDHLDITTNKGQNIKGGGSGGELSEVTGKIIALGGSSGEFLDQIDIFGNLDEIQSIDIT